MATTQGQPVDAAPLPPSSEPAAQISTTAQSTSNPTPPPSQPSAEIADPAPADPKPSVDTTTPPFSPSSQTPVLEKDETELDFAGNVDVNDDIPSEKDLKKANDLMVLDSEGKARPFRELYMGDNVAPRQLIIFVRHFFCGNCQEYLRHLSASITPDSLLSLPVPTFITVIGCGRPELIDMYVKTTGCPFPVYAEPTRKLYDTLGMTRTFDLGKEKPSYIQSNLFVTSVQSIMQGLKTGKRAMSGGDFKQVGGEFLFEGGNCKWVHRMRNTRDHSSVEEVRKVVGLSDAKPPMRKRWSHGIKEMRSEKRAASWGRMRSKSRGTKDGSKTPEEKEEKEEILKINGRPTI